MRILVVSNLYPSSAHPAFGTFVAARVDALRRAGQAVDVVAATDPRVHRNLIPKYLALFFRSLLAAFRGRVAHGRFDVVEAHIAFPTGLIAYVASRIAGGRLVLFAHGADVNSVPWRSGLRASLARFVFRRADLVVANSSFTASRAMRLGPLKRPPVIVSPGIHLPSGERQSQARSGVLYVGRLTPEKGVRELLLATAAIDQPAAARLTIVGDGPQRQELEALARSLAISVDFRGPLPPAAVGELMDRATVVAMPSVYEEPLGLVAIEGMAHGAIVVASRTGGLAETMEDGVNGFAVPPGDVAALSRAIREALELEAAPAAAMRDVGVATAREHDIETSVRRTLQAYLGLVDVADRETLPTAPEERANTRRIHVAGVPVDDLTMAETLAAIEAFIAERGPHQQISINVSKVVQAARDPNLLDILEHTDLLNVDGLPVVWASRLLGSPLRERVAGVDLMLALIAQCAARGHRMYFLGARPEIVLAVVDRVSNEFPIAAIAGFRDGYWQPDAEADVVAAIAESKADVLFVALGSPRKEQFLARWRSDLQVPFAMGVGGSFDVYAGVVRRAPVLMQRLGLEWVFRVSQEPRRLFARYAGDAPRFVWLVFQTRLRNRTR